MFRRRFKVQRSNESEGRARLVDAHEVVKAAARTEAPIGIWLPILDLERQRAGVTIVLVGGAEAVEPRVSLGILADAHVVELERGRLVDVRDVHDGRRVVEKSAMVHHARAEREIALRLEVESGVLRDHDRAVTQDGEFLARGGEREAGNRVLRIRILVVRSQRAHDRIRQSTLRELDLEGLQRRRLVDVANVNRDGVADLRLPRIRRHNREVKEGRDFKVDTRLCGDLPRLVVQDEEIGRFRRKRVRQRVAFVVVGCDDGGPHLDPSCRVFEHHARVDLLQGARHRIRLCVERGHAWCGGESPQRSVQPQRAQSAPKESRRLIPAHR